MPKTHKLTQTVFPEIGPLKPFMFSFEAVNGARENIVLYATDFLECWKDNVGQLPGLFFDYQVRGPVLRRR